jgi:hypothetical protein
VQLQLLHQSADSRSMQVLIRSQPALAASIEEDGHRTAALAASIEEECRRAEQQQRKARTLAVGASIVEGRDKNRRTDSQKGEDGTRDRDR